MRHKIPDFSKPRTGPGENGRGVEVTADEKAQADRDMKEWFMNVVARYAHTLLWNISSHLYRVSDRDLASNIFCRFSGHLAAF